MTDTISFMVIVGIDEVGRGCWAGPLVAGAVILPQRFKLRQGSTNRLVLRDSKKMTKLQRASCDIWIRENAVDYGLGWVSAAEVDEIGLTASVRLAMERAISEINADYTDIIIDGSINYLAPDPRSTSLIKADNSIPPVSAASIIAKVARDGYMKLLDGKYAGYGFGTHVGYGTAAHVKALEALGVSDIHRKSYKPIQALMLRQKYQ